ncbi:hypothetical protein [Leptospira adleri]|uniref:Uncharacterized protein n=1 Tax=Leptospira adleri TaxID=2023186 RepID=A0A2M9YLD1_9LEPT|nr:hypothetical protein [Leptospira adleri]PJZ52359.1 hypothetical protein CH380_15790 [Leptospira adleri]PJZ60010.1 hypothetical protein CH376_20625 [Leptospira adleri]
MLKIANAKVGSNDPNSSTGIRFRTPIFLAIYVFAGAAFCKPAEIDNVCDPSSAQYQQDTLLQTIFGEETGRILGYKSAACRPVAAQATADIGPKISFNLTSVKGGGLTIRENKKNLIREIDSGGNLIFENMSPEEEYSFEIIAQPDHQTCSIGEPEGLFKDDLILEVSCSPLIVTSSYSGGDQTYASNACGSMLDVSPWSPIVLNLRIPSRALLVYNGFFKTNSDPFALIRQGIDWNGTMILAQDRLKQISSAEFSSTNSRIIGLPAGVHTFSPKICSDSSSPVLAGSFKSTFSVVILETLSTYSSSSFASSSTSSTNSTSPTLISGLNLDLNLNEASPVFYAMHLNSPLSVAGAFYYPNILSDSSTVESTGTFNFTENNARTPSSLFGLTQYSAGNHNFQGRWNTQSASNVISNVSAIPTAPSVLNAIQFKPSLKSQIFWRATGWDASSGNGFLDVSGISSLELTISQSARILFFLQAGNFKSSSNTCKIGVERNGDLFLSARMSASGTNAQHDPISILSVETLPAGYHSFVMRYWSENGALCEFPGTSNREINFGYIVLE